MSALLLLKIGHMQKEFTKESKDQEPIQSSTISDPDLNWCPVIVSNRQQVSPILSLAVISLLIDQ